MSFLKMILRNCLPWIQIDIAASSPSGILREDEDKHSTMLLPLLMSQSRAFLISLPSQKDKRVHTLLFHANPREVNFDLIH